MTRKQEKDVGGEIEKVFESRRNFSMDDGNTYYIGVPSAEDIRRADWHYSKTYNQALVDGVTLASQMRQILEERGIVGEDHDKRAEELRGRLDEKVVALQFESDLDRKEDLAKEVAALRDEIFRWNQRLNGPMSNTCEQIAEDARIEYLTSRIIQDEEGDPVWKTHEDYLNDPRQGLTLRARYEVMLWMNGLESDFLERTPERLVLEEIRKSREESARKKTEQVEDPVSELMGESSGLEAKNSKSKVRKKRIPKTKKEPGKKKSVQREELPAVESETIPA